MYDMVDIDMYDKMFILHDSRQDVHTSHFSTRCSYFTILTNVIEEITSWTFSTRTQGTFIYIYYVLLIFCVLCIYFPIVRYKLSFVRFFLNTPYAFYQILSYTFICLSWNKYRLLYSWLYNTEIYLDKCPVMTTIFGKVIWARVQIYFGIVQSTVKLLFYYISNCLKKMPLLNYILVLLSYHENNKTLHTFDF